MQKTHEKNKVIGDIKPVAFFFLRDIVLIDHDIAVSSRMHEDDYDKVTIRAREDVMNKIIVLCVAFVSCLAINLFAPPPTNEKKEPVSSRYFLLLSSSDDAGSHDNEEHENVDGDEEGEAGTDHDGEQEAIQDDGVDNEGDDEGDDEGDTRDHTTVPYLDQRCELLEGRIQDVTLALKGYDDDLRDWGEPIGVARAHRLCSVVNELVRELRRITAETVVFHPEH